MSRILGQGGMLALVLCGSMACGAGSPTGPASHDASGAVQITAGTLVACAGPADSDGCDWTSATQLVAR